MSIEKYLERGVKTKTAQSDYNVYMTLAEGKIGTVPLRFTEYAAATYRLWQEVRPKRKSSHRVFIALAGKSPGVQVSQGVQNSHPEWLKQLYLLQQI